MRTSSTTRVIKEPGVPEVTVETAIWPKLAQKLSATLTYDYTPRDAPNRTRKSTEEKITFHSKKLKKKYRGDMKIRHRQTDKTSGIFSANSNISKVMSTRKPTKPQPLMTRSRKPCANPKTSAASSTSSHSTSKGKPNRRAPDFYRFESSVCLVSDQDVASIPKRPRTTNPVIRTILQEEASSPLL